MFSRETANQIVCYMPGLGQTLIDPDKAVAYIVHEFGMSLPEFETMTFRNQKRTLNRQCRLGRMGDISKHFRT